MTRAQYLNQLYRRLGALTREQAEQHLTYYAEILADKMEEGMSEAEAVASMEDVDTVARRILSDEGMEGSDLYPPQPPEEEKNETPAQAQTPPRRRWPPGTIALTVAALVLIIVLLVLTTVAVVSFLGFRQITSTAVVEDTPVIVDEDGEYISIGPDGLEIRSGEDQVSIGPDGFHVESAEGNVVSIGPGGVRADTEEETAPIDTSAAAAPAYTVSAEDLEKLAVEWVDGHVIIEVWDGEDVVFFEKAERTLTEREQLSYSLERGTLEIQYRESGFMPGLTWTIGGKDLVVQLPRTLAEEGLSALTLDVTSSDLSIENVNAKRLEIDAVSGSCTAKGSFVDVQADTTSGDLTLEGSVEEVSFDAVSGSLTVYADRSIERLEADTVSGNVTLYVPEDHAMDVTFDTVSGEMERLDG